MSTWNLQAFPVGPLQTNAYLLTSGQEAILVDPGDHPVFLLDRIEATGCRLTHLLCTHGHFDHVGSAAAIQAAWDLPLLCHPADRHLIERMAEIQSAYGFAASPLPRVEPGLTEGQTIPFAGGEILVRHVPGHSPGHVMFVREEEALVGDCVFAGSIGRTDLPGSDFGTLERSIREKIYTLSDATRLHPGHGPATSVGRERLTNPFVRQAES